MVFLFASYGLVYFCRFSYNRTPRNKNAEERTFPFQLAQLCSRIVFLIFWGGLKNVLFLLKTLKIVVSAYLEKATMAQKCQKVESKIGPMLSQEMAEACCAT